MSPQGSKRPGEGSKPWAPVSTGSQGRRARVLSGGGWAREHPPCGESVTKPVNYPVTKWGLCGVTEEGHGGGGVPLWGHPEGLRCPFETAVTQNENLTATVFWPAGMFGVSERLPEGAHCRASSVARVPVHVFFRGGWRM